MTRMMDPSIMQLSQLLSEMGDMAIKSVQMAVSSYLRGENTAKKVKRLSDGITKTYNQVGDLTFEIMFKYQPVASDFRFIRSAIEISHAYHRFGRYAYDISQVRDEFGDISHCKTEWLSGASAEILQMTKSATESFATLDIKKAQRIQENEDYVDKLYRGRIPMLILHHDTKCALAEALLLRYLERIGDHAVFMSRAVIYIVTGRHETG